VIEIKLLCLSLVAIMLNAYCGMLVSMLLLFICNYVFYRCLNFVGVYFVMTSVLSS